MMDITKRLKRLIWQGRIGDWYIQTFKNIAKIYVNEYNDWYEKGLKHGRQGKYYGKN